MTRISQILTSYSHQFGLAVQRGIFVSLETRLSSAALDDILPSIAFMITVKRVPVSTTIF
jgi:hypothetical protein